jgi:hypothetical protein
MRHYYWRVRQAARERLNHLRLDMVASRRIADERNVTHILVRSLPAFGFCRPGIIPNTGLSFSKGRGEGILFSVI